MKKLLFILMVLFNLHSFAQVTYHFPHDSVTWGQFSGFWGNGIYGWTYNYTAQGDTLINNHIFMKIFSSTNLNNYATNDLSYALRGDSTGKVYYKNFSISAADTSEMLLYDFSIETSDTFYTAFSPQSFDYLVVSQVDSITLLTGEKRKRFLFFNQGCGGGFMASDQLVWIEGIGSNAGLLYPVGNCYPDDLEWLTCFHQNDTLKYASGDSCNLILGIEKDLTKNNIQIIDIGNNKFLIKNLEKLKGKITVRIIDLSGRELASNIISKEEKIDLSNFSQGIYFIQLNSNKESLIRKVVIK